MRMEMVRRDPTAGRLGRALVASAAAVGVAATVTDIVARPWSSATFTGARNRVALAAEAGPARARWLATLPEAEWRIPGHIVADLSVDAVSASGVTLTLLLLADA